MRKFLLLILLSIFLHAESSPTEGVLETRLAIAKSKTTIDKNDTRVFDLLDELYENILQSDKLTPKYKKTINKLLAYMGNKKMPNRHILFLFFYYQQYISQAGKRGEPIDPKIQMSIIKHLIDSSKEYNKTPIIAYIYAAEAAMASKQDEEAIKMIRVALNLRKDSIPAKVYFSLLLPDTKEGKEYKKDLLEHHSSHWLVKKMMRYLTH